MIHGNKGLSKEPYNYYIQSYCINNSDVYVIGIKSTGEVKIIKHFVFNYHGIEEKKITTLRIRLYNGGIQTFR